MCYRPAILGIADVTYTSAKYGVTDSRRVTILTTLDDGFRWSIGCINLTDWTITSVDVGNVFVPSVTGDPEGGVWVAQAAGFDYTDTDTSDDQIGITRWDPAKCSSSTSVQTALQPSSLETVIVPAE